MNNEKMFNLNKMINKFKTISLNKVQPKAYQIKQNKDFLRNK
jgi:hypothetical protein